MISILITILFIVILFKLTGYMFHIAGKLLGWLLLGNDIAFFVKNADGNVNDSCRTCDQCNRTCGLCPADYPDHRTDRADCRCGGLNHLTLNMLTIERNDGNAGYL